MKFKVGIAQTPNSTELEKNFAAIDSFLQQFEFAGVELVVFPECSLSGFSAKMKECDRATLLPYLNQVQEWTNRTGIEVALPTAIVEGGHIFNSGFWFKPGSAQQFFKVGLTDSETKFFSVPLGSTPKVFFLNGIRFGVLMCFEAQHGPWDYFDSGQVDVILWPGYWGWTAESCWREGTSPNEPNLIYLNQRVWKAPILQANFAFNDLEEYSGSGPEGLSVVIDSDNSLVYRGAHRKAEGFVVAIERQKERFRVVASKPLD